MKLLHKKDTILKSIKYLYLDDIEYLQHKSEIGYRGYKPISHIIVSGGIIVTYVKYIPNRTW